MGDVKQAENLLEEIIVKLADLAMKSCAKDPESEECVKYESQINKYQGNLEKIKKNSSNINININSLYNYLKKLKENRSKESNTNEMVLSGENSLGKKSFDDFEIKNDIVKVKKAYKELSKFLKYFKDLLNKALEKIDEGKKLTHESILEVKEKHQGALLFYGEYKNHKPQRTNVLRSVKTMMKTSSNSKQTKIEKWTEAIELICKNLSFIDCMEIIDENVFDDVFSDFNATRNTAGFSRDMNLLQDIFRFKGDEAWGILDRTFLYFIDENFSGTYRNIEIKEFKSLRSRGYVKNVGYIFEYYKPKANVKLREGKTINPKVENELETKLEKKLKNVLNDTTQCLSTSSTRTPPPQETPQETPTPPQKTPTQNTQQQPNIKELQKEVNDLKTRINTIFEKTNKNAVKAKYNKEIEALELRQEEIENLQTKYNKQNEKTQAMLDKKKSLQNSEKWIYEKKEGEVQDGEEQKEEKGEEQKKFEMERQEAINIFKLYENKMPKLKKRLEDSEKNKKKYESKLKKLRYLEKINEELEKIDKELEEINIKQYSNNKEKSYRKSLSTFNVTIQKIEQSFKPTKRSRTEGTISSRVFVPRKYNILLLKRINKNILIGLRNDSKNIKHPMTKKELNEVNRELILVNSVINVIKRGCIDNIKPRLFR